MSQKLRAGIVGWPVEHSLSPLLHGYWLKQYGIDGEMLRVPAPPEEFANVIARLRAEGLRGVNVTVPHKQAAFAMADDADMAAQIAGAANLLIFGQDGKISARNTDGLGLQMALQERLGGTLAAKSAVLLGAGGAARGALLALAGLGLASVHILNRNPQRAEALAAELQSKVKPTLVPAGLTAWRVATKNVALLINATSAGMTGSQNLQIDLASLPPSAAVCDIVYDPLETKLLKDAKARGHKTIDGLGMLMHQAAPSFEAFFGAAPEVTPGLRAELERVLRARQL